MGFNYFKVRMKYVGDDLMESDHTLYFHSPDFPENAPSAGAYFRETFTNTMRTMPRRLKLSGLMSRMKRGMGCCDVTFLGERTVEQNCRGTGIPVWKPRGASIPEGIRAEPLDVGICGIDKINGIKGSDWILYIEGDEINQAPVEIEYRQAPSLLQSALNAIPSFR